MESGKFKMSVYMKKRPFNGKNEKFYVAIKDIVKDMKPNDIKSRWWLNDYMRALIDYKQSVTLEGTADQFLELMKYNVKVKGLLVLDESLFVM